MYADLRGWDSAGERASTGFALLLPSLAVQLAQLTPLQIHTHTLFFYGLRGLSIGVMVFILYKLYFLSPYT